MKGAKVNYNRNVKAHLTNEDRETIECMRVWIRKARIFRKKSGDSEQQDLRNVGVIR